MSPTDRRYYCFFCDAWIEPGQGIVLWLPAQGKKSVRLIKTAHSKDCIDWPHDRIEDWQLLAARVDDIAEAVARLRSENWRIGFAAANWLANRWGMAWKPLGGRK